MYMIYSFAPPVIATLGIPSFLVLYFGSAVSSAAASLYFSTRNNPHRGSLGASGSLSATMAMFALLNPSATVYLFVVPVNVVLAVFGFFAFDLYRSVSGSTSVVDSAGHVGGAAFGVAYFMQKYGRRLIRR
ncbi:hypothetical protein HK098_007741 [Nowakowskiella sp. JEL0407]|nr:hypothetical protein HK098_007741 [Nowakowskiella sp. JEL0407]